MSTAALIAQMSPELQSEVDAYNQMRAELEDKYWGKWVVIQGGELFGAYDDSEEAAVAAVRKFGRETFLIQKIGPPLPETSLPMIARIRGANA